MRLFLLGATGRTGAQVLELALARGHDVTAFVRSPGKLSPAKLTRGAPAPRVVAGDARDSPALAAAMRGHDAVLSALGPHAREAFRPSTLMTECAAATVAAMKEAGVARLAVVSAAVLFPEKGPLFAFFRWFLKHHARDLADMETLIRAAAGIDWTIVRPPRLTRSTAQAYRALPDALPPGARAISFRAVAAFLLDAVERGAGARAVVGLGPAVES